MSVSSFDAERAKHAKAACAQAVAARSTGAIPLQRKSLEEAIAIYRQLAERDPDTYALELSRCLDDLSPCLSLFGEFQAAADAARESMRLIEVAATRRAEPLPEPLATATLNLAKAMTRLGQWADGVRYAEDAARLLEPLATPESIDGQLAHAAALSCVSMWRSVVERYADAIAPGEQVLALLRQVRASHPGTFTSEFIETGVPLALSLVEVGRVPDAARLCDELMPMVRAAMGQRAARDGLGLVRLLMVQARCATALGDPEAAHAHLEEAIRFVAPFFERTPDPLMLLVGHLFKDFFEASARLHRQTDPALLAPYLARLQQGPSVSPPLPPSP